MPPAGVCRFLAKRRHDQRSSRKQHQSDDHFGRIRLENAEYHSLYRRETMPRPRTNRNCRVWSRSARPARPGQGRPARQRCIRKALANCQGLIVKYLSLRVRAGFRVAPLRPRRSREQGKSSCRNDKGQHCIRIGEMQAPADDTSLQYTRRRLSFPSFPFCFSLVAKHAFFQFSKRLPFRRVCETRRWNAANRGFRMPGYPT